MRTKMTKEEIVNWIEDTVNEIKELLQKEQIPYTDSWTRDDTSLYPMYPPYYTHQLLFPWDKGDVVIGTLHCFDDDIVLGRKQPGYPSIETYRFPWDADDITVFDTPEEFIKTLKDYYISKEETNNAKTVPKTSEFD